MKKISVRDLIDFRKRSDRGKKTFVEKIKSNKIEAPQDGGGDYWIPSLSAIRNSFRNQELNLINDKIDDLKEKLSTTKLTLTKNMYQRNIAVLQEYKKLDLQKLRPNEKITFLRKSTDNTVLTIKGLQIESKPCFVYTFGRKDEEKVGAIWFTAKVNGYRIEEVCLFCEVLQRFLKSSFAKKYELVPNFCIAVEVLSGQIINYTDIENGNFPQILNSTLDQINRLL